MIGLLLSASCSDRENKHVPVNGTTTSTSTPEQTFAKWMKEAEAGKIEAQFDVGNALEKGIGAAKDSSKAAEWYQKAASQGLGKAEAALGSAYIQGKGVPKDLIKGAELLVRAASRNDPSGEFQLGQAYRTGNGMEQDITKAVELFNKAASQNYLPAMASLGDMYLEGKDVPLDPQRGLQLLQKAADGNDARGLSNLAAVYHSGNGAAIDRKKSFELAIRAATLGDDNAKFGVGIRYHTGDGVDQDPRKAADWYQTAINSDDDEVVANAEAELGAMYVYGTEIPKNLKAGIELLEKAASKGSSYAMVTLARQYYLGEGLPKDAAKSFALSIRASEQKNESFLGSFRAHGQVSVGDAYLRGIGVEKNLTKAADYYRLAAIAGNAKAQQNLSWLYQYGKGVDRNLTIAYGWLNLSLAAPEGDASNDAKGKAGRDKLENLMTPEEIAIAQEMSSSWKKGSDLVVNTSTK